MGCQGPKSCIEVRQHQTFLDLTVRQISHLNHSTGQIIPLILMNSFNTDADTSNIVRKYDTQKMVIDSFNQNKYPRIYADSLLPMITDWEGEHHEWYPPGHGDVYQSFSDSGLLDRYLESGKEWAFVSNIDNLGATVDFTILAAAIANNKDFVMEVTDKTRADIKGGTIIQFGERPLKLLEIAQVPKEHVHDFMSIKKFKVFNTNNLWINLKSLKTLLQKPNPFADMDIICNPKMEKGQRIVQLETAAGAAISLFQNTQAINVPRYRFLPVKSTSDLFVLQSDLFSLENGVFKMSKLRAFPNPPMVKLGPYMKEVAAYLKRFGGSTNIIDLDTLTISGDVTVGRHVVFKGTVIIVAAEGDKIDIPDGSILEDKVVTGSLRILDH
jgi:UTP--glucose-1-phosphate uridylyltransferase